MALIQPLLPRRASPLLRLGLLLAGLPLMLLTGASTCQAAMHTLTPFFQAGVTYADDLFFADVSSFEMSWTPGASYEYATERSRLNLDTRVTYTDNLSKDEYDRLTTLNRLNQSYQLTRRLGASIGAVVGIQETYITAFEELGLVGNDTREYRYSFPVGLTYALTDRSFLGLSYAYSIFDYTDDDNFSDHTSHSTGLSLAYRLTPRATVTPSASYSHVQYEATLESPGLDQDVITPGLDLSYLLTELITVGANAGVSFVKTSFAGVDEDRSTRLFVCGVRGAYTGMRATASIHAGRSVDQSLLGENLIHDSIGSSITYAVTENLSLGISGFYSENETIDSDDNETYRAFRISPVITFNQPFRLSENFTLDIGYDMYFALKKDSEHNTHDDSHETSNRAFVLLTWRLPMRN